MNLTPRGTWIGALILLLGALAQWVPYEAASAWRGLFVLYLVLLATEAWFALRLPLRAEWPEMASLQLGEPSRLSLQLQGSTRAQTLSIWLVPPIGFAGTVEAQTVQLPLTGVTLERRWIPQQLGDVALPVPLLRVLGRFGLCWWHRQLTLDAASVRVVPSLGSLTQARAGTRRQSGTPRTQNDRSGALLSLREYRQGDALRTIAWKSSARRGQWLVRTFLAEEQLDLMLVLDAGRTGCQPLGKLTRLHHAVNAAARIAEQAVAAGDHVGVLSFGPRGAEAALPPQAGLPGLRRVRERLALLQASPGESDPVEAATAVARCCRRRTLVLWFTDVDAGAAAIPLAFAAALLQPRHLPLFAGLQDRGLHAVLDQDLLRWKDPYVNLAAQRLLDAAELQARQLRRAGCLVVRAAPDHIDAVLLSTWRQLREQRRV